jgi:hypothetical protein
MVLSNSGTNVLLIVTALATSSHVFADYAIDGLLSNYRARGAGDFSAQRGQSMWTEVRGEGHAESCAMCHTRDLTKPGKHIRTGKPIDSLAPSVNPGRLTDAAKIEKWFLRNCKGTWDRECTDQEKGDFLLYIRSQ